MAVRPFAPLSAIFRREDESVSCPQRVSKKAREAALKTKVPAGKRLRE
jgi:hypothetical protein